MELGIARSNCSIEICSHSVFVDVRRTFSELIGEKVDKVLHEVTLGHEKVLTDVRAVPLQLVFSEENVQKLLVCLLVRSLHPLLQLIDIQIVLLGLEWCLKR